MPPAWRIVLLALCLAAAAAALDLTKLQPQGHVSDFAGVLNPAHRAELERYCRQVAAATKVEIAIVTLPTLEGEPIEDVANSLFRRWGIGQKGQNEGLLLLLVPNDRRMRLEVGYGLEGAIPDGFSGSLLRSMRPLLRERRYGEALLEAAHQLGTRIAEEKKVSLTGGLPSRRDVSAEQFRHSLIPFLIPLGFLALFFALAAATRRRHRRSHGFFPVFFPGADWSLGRFSGGGFGGYDSSDSFGGFGGGDSGGGGASSDW
ncbi:MAG: TPM domain-containing protein [Bryobacteraceae bacterium]|nr:TPM domain-containing protein [Bryobacteraceae bacterium]MDW8378848.1 TPM domain-containing protein [Bryobacterales bacterium]